ncbi:MAG: divergent polysaccharide deacetylase family protein [Candidatus Omnitrophota bacterium]
MKRHKIIILSLIAIVILEGIFIVYLWKGRQKPIPMPKAVMPVKGRIAVVIDDWGYNQNPLEVIRQIKYPLTMAILPNLAYSSSLARELHDLGFEIILHLPMEPEEKYRLEKDTLLSSMSPSEIVNIINKDLLNISHCRGVSNHMGSKLTSNTKIMNIIFKELTNRQLYFLDSLVDSNSICADLDRQMDIKFAKRDVFLDNKEDPQYIKMQLYRLKTKAKIYGQAIGIGHTHKTTLEVLKEVLPELEKEGYKFVFVSELTK